MHFGQGSDEQADRAWVATQRMRAMLPNLEAFARAVAKQHGVGNASQLKVEISNYPPRTDGNVIKMPPIMALADDVSHQRELCLVRNSQDGQQLCPACQQQDIVMSHFAHEIGHIIEHSFEKVQGRSQTAAIRRGIKTLAKDAPEKAARLQEAFDGRGNEGMSINEVAGRISPFLTTINFALEDLRVNHGLGKSRPGSIPMMAAKAQRIAVEGIEHTDGTFTRWADLPLNSQMMIGMLLYGSGHEQLLPYLDEKIGEVLQSDPELQALVNEAATLPNRKGVYELSLRVWDAARKHGFFVSEDDPVEPPPPPPPPPMDSEQGGDTDDQMDDGESTESDTPDPGDGDTGDDAGEADDQDTGGDDDEVGDGPGDDTEPDDGEQSESSDDGGDASGGDDDQDDEPGDGSGGESDADDDEQDGDTESDDGEDAGSGGDDAEQNASDDGSDLQADESDESDEAEGSSAGDQPEDAEGEASNDDSDGQAGSSAEDEAFDEQNLGSDDADDDAEYEPGDDGSDMSEPGDDDVDAPVSHDDGSNMADHDGQPVESDNMIDWGDAEQAEDALKLFGGHDDDEGDESDDDEFEREAIELAVAQSEHFDHSSQNVRELVLHKYDDPNDPALAIDLFDAWQRDENQDYLPTVDDFESVQAIVGPAVNRLRRIFADNARAKRVPHRSGRVRGARLASVRTGEKEVFERVKLPGKKDYEVCLMVDISGSNAGIANFLRQMTFTCAEMLNRLDIKFSIYGHTGHRTGYRSGRGNQFTCDVYVIKDVHELWSNATRNRLAKIRPSSNNLDGHALEFARKRMDESGTTKKIIMYVTDGAMPAANSHEEGIILENELVTCKQRDYTIIGVGLHTDSPRQHGLDTAEVNEPADLPKVVNLMEKYLT